MKQAIDTQGIGVLFDLDGVLLDTEGIYSEFWAGIDEMYPTGVDNFTAVIKGSNLERILGTYFPADKHQNIIRILTEFQNGMQYRYFAGARQWLDTLKAAGIPMAVVTSSDQGKVDAVSAQHPEFRGYFDAVIVGEMVANPKPDPECYLLGAKQIGVDVSRCWVFEDSLNGLRAGKASGAHVVALATTLPREAVAPHASLVIDGFENFTIDQMLAAQ